MLDAGERMFAYPFEGYWKDVGTIDSLWEANMDLLDPKVTLDLKDIYSRNPMMPPHYVSNEASIQIHSLPTDAMFTATLSSQFSLQVLQSVKCYD